MANALMESALIDDEARRVLASAHVIERTDAFRLLIMYTMGGFFQVRHIQAERFRACYSCQTLNTILVCDYGLEFSACICYVCVV